MTKDRQNCIIDCRISSPKQQAGGGLDDQKNVCLNFVNGKGWNVLRIYSKVYSGRAEEREDFEEILEYIKKAQSGGRPVHYYVVKSIDRFTRDGAVTFDEMKGRLSHIGVQLIDAYGIIQPEQNTLEYLGFEYKWSKRSPTATAQLAEAQRAKDEVTDILTRTISASIRLTQDGYKVRQANDGYINERIVVDGKKRVIEKPDPQRSKYFIEIFNLRASGVFTDKEIVDKVNAMGYKSRTRNRWDKNHQKIIGHQGGRKLTVKEMQRLITRPIYAGMRCERWTHNRPVKTRYEGLVSIKTFNEANRGKVYIDCRSDRDIRILYNDNPEKTTSRRSKNNPLFPFKFLLCHLCRKPFFGSEPVSKSRKKVPTYHCGNNSRRHAYFGVNKRIFEEKIERYVKSLQFEPDYSNNVEVALLNKYREREKEILDDSVAMHTSIADLKTKQAAKIEAIVDTESAIVRRRLEEEVEQLEIQINESGNELLKIEVTEADIKSFISEARKLLEHPGELLLNQDNPEIRKALFSLVFEEIPTYQEIAFGTPKLAWIFRLSPVVATRESQLAGSWSISWNTIEKTILQWREVSKLISLNNNVDPTKISEEGELGKAA